MTISTTLRRITKHLAVGALVASSFVASAAFAQLTVYVVRHGQTDWNKEGRIQGSTDNPLNSTGREQAATTAKMLENVKLDAVYTSSHKRARETAAVFEGRAPITAMDEMRERNYGKFEGSSDKDQANVADWNKRRFGWTDDMEGGESLENQSKRADAAIAKIRERHKTGGSILLVGHGGINPLMICNMLGLPPAEFAKTINQGNDEVYRIEIPKSGTAVIWKMIPLTKLNEL
jgi:2,3-bisphosphoglycerate-dependent phosphoglycerate mutase